MYRRKSLGPVMLLVLIPVFLLAACGGKEPAPTPAPVVAPSTGAPTTVPASPAPADPVPTEATAPAAAPTDEPAPPVPAPTPKPEATLPVADPALSPLPAPEVAAAYGRTEDGFYVRGRADAPVTIIDYSDFL